MSDKLNDVSIASVLGAAPTQIIVRSTLGFIAVIEKHNSAGACSDNDVSIGSRLCVASLPIFIFRLYGQCLRHFLLQQHSSVLRRTHANL